MIILDNDPDPRLPNSKVEYDDPTLVTMVAPMADKESESVLTL
jgi:hypothetical protein